MIFSLSASFQLVQLVSLDLNVLGYHRTYQNFKILHQFRTHTSHCIISIQLCHSSGDSSQ